MAKKRQSKADEWADTFSQKTKKFSAFDMLGVNDSNIDRGVDPLTGQRADSLTHGLTHGTKGRPSDPESDSVPVDILPERSDGLTIQKDSNRQSDSLTVEQIQQPQSDSLPIGIPLAPIQWKVWNHIRDKEGLVLNYQMLAEDLHTKSRGIRHALDRLHSLGLITGKKTYRSRKEQGFLITVNPEGRAHLVEAHVAASLRRSARQSEGRPSDRGSDPVSLYKKEHTYREILEMFPSSWSIREQALKEIARLFPEMTTLEFKHSCRQLIEQEKTGPKIEHHNRWLVAAFEKTGGPLVTETDLDVQLTKQKHSERMNTPRIDADMVILRRYLAANEAERAEIDQIAAENAAQMLEVVSEDKREGVLQEARLEAAREYFSAQDS